MTPLAKRLPRELKNNIGRYLGMFLLMAVSTALVSGFLLAASSIERIVGGMRDDYGMEDGRFTTNFEAPEAAIAAVEELGCTVEPIFSYDAPLEVLGKDGAAGSEADLTVRVYGNRDKVDLAAYVAGAQPAAADQIAIDRVFAAHNGIDVGSKVRVAGMDFVVSGIMTLPDYSSLFEKNSDFVFNALTFSVAEATPEALAAIEGAGVSASYTYAYVLDDRDMELADRLDFEADVARALVDNGAVATDMIDREANVGITYAADDVVGDQVMWEVLLFLVVVIMAFVFVVLTNSTIEAESAVIGTLLASGYRKREIVAHYLAMPVLVGLAAVVLGSAAGFALLTDPMKDLYYNSYSLPPYHTIWNWRVFVITAVVPFVLLVTITLVGLVRRMGATPLQFLRHEALKGGSSGGLRLPERLPFTARFGLRVFLRNLGSFATLFFGIALASVVLLLGLCLIPTVDNYAQSMKADLVAEHQYSLKVPLEIDATDEQREAFAAAEELVLGDSSEMGAMRKLQLAMKAKDIDPDANYINTLENSDEAIEQAEKYAAYQLDVLRAMGGMYESATVYGVKPDSAYWEGLDVGDGKVVVGQGLVEKCDVQVGAACTFVDRYQATSYELVPTSTWGGRTNTNVYMAIDDLNRLLGNDADHFDGYVSDLPLNLQGRYVASDLTPDSMDKITRQMTDSMGTIMRLILGVAVFIFVVLMYLLTKTVIDRSARSISYMKVFGYRDREVDRFYIRPVTIAVVASLIGCIPIIVALVDAIVRIVFMQYNGNFPLLIPLDRYAVLVGVGVVSYGVVALLHVRHIRSVPLSLALKVQE